MSKWNCFGGTFQAVNEALGRMFNKNIGRDNLSKDVTDYMIIETGSNSNGYYRKWADGTLECWKENFGIYFSDGAFLRTVWTFPAAFISQPSVQVSAMGCSADKYTGLLGSDSGITSCTIWQHFYPGTSFVSGDYRDTHLYAVGRWK